MTDVAPQFETADQLGSTDQFNGTVGTGSTPVPTVAGDAISEVMISNPSTNTPSKKLYVSFDTGTTWFTLNTGTAMSWNVRGSKTQIHLKGSAASTDYETIMNREPA